MGYVSDRTRSRWGRRRPYIFVGALLASLVFALLWQLPEGRSESFYFWFFLIGSLLFFLAYTMFATPWVALGYELTPDYHERTRLMGVRNFTGQLAHLLSPRFLWFMELDVFGGLAEGASALAVGVALACALTGVLPALLLRERHGQGAQHSGRAAGAAAARFWRETGRFFAGFAQTVRSAEFLKLCAVVFLVFNGFQLVAAFQSYVIIYYISGGEQTERTLLLMRIFDVAFPMLASALAIWFVARYGITQERADAIRVRLEARRTAGDP